MQKNATVTVDLGLEQRDITAQRREQAKADSSHQFTCHYLYNNKIPKGKLKQD